MRCGRSLPRTCARALGPAFAIGLLTVTALGAQADVRPWPARSRPADEPWRRWRLVANGGVMFPVNPADFSLYWDPALGVGFGLISPVTPMFDLIARIDGYGMAFDGASFENDFAARPDSPPGRASVTPALLLARLHREAEGLRPFVDAGLGLLDVSRPSVFYHDSTGRLGVLGGSEIFGLDPCFAFGGGVEWMSFDHFLGGFIEARFIVAPGRTELAHTVFALQSGLILTPR